MNRTFIHPIVIQKVNNRETYDNLYKVHAYVNKTADNSEYLNGGAIQSKRKLTFEIRYFKELEDIALNTQKYRIVFENAIYNITSYDDYLLQHKTVKMLGQSIG